MKKIRENKKVYKDRYRRKGGQGELLLVPILLLLWMLISLAQIFYYKDKDPFSENFTVADYSGQAYSIVNDNMPFFKESEITEKSFEIYAGLDEYGRCRGAMACLGYDLMPAGERKSISSVKPTGWKAKKYDFIDEGYLYNRSHLIGFQLSGENANERNLITGTRYMNIKGMLPFENKVAEYIRKSKNHVMYRVRPLFEGNHLLAKGVLMEAWSVEDEGRGICFNVFCYNIEPGVLIDYRDGSSRKE